MIHWNTASTDDKIAAITLLDKQGLVFSEVAEQLGINHGALHGFIFRNRKRVNRPPAKRTAWHLLGNAEARIARVQELDGQGMTPTQIGQELGVSAARIVAVMREKKRPLASDVRVRPMPFFPVLPELPAETWLPVGGPRPLSIMEVNEYTCRWPIEIDGVPRGFCGQHAHKKSYCAVHHAIAYPPAPAATVGAVREVPKRRRPIPAGEAMALAGVAARRVEVAGE